MSFICGVLAIPVNFDYVVSADLLAAHHAHALPTRELLLNAPRT